MILKIVWNPFMANDFILKNKQLLFAIKAIVIKLAKENDGGIYLLANMKKNT